MQATLWMMLGTRMGLVPGTTTWIAGLMMHLIISGLIAVLYALGLNT